MAGSGTSGTPWISVESIVRSLFLIVEEGFA